MKRVSIFMGNYGCGKTELSIATALFFARAGERVTLADMDIVNPYFRSSEKRELLENAGIRVIAPYSAGMQVDLPALTSELYSAFDTEGRVIIDCGGDPAGATALGAYADRIAALAPDCGVYFVINARRPLLATADAAQEMLRELIYVSNVQVTGLINNTNLSAQTSAEDVIYGYEVTAELSRRTGLPIVMNSGMKEPMSGFSERIPDHQGELFLFCPCMRPYWQ